MNSDVAKVRSSVLRLVQALNNIYEENSIIVHKQESRPVKFSLEELVIADRLLKMALRLWLKIFGVRKKSWKLNVAVGAYSPLTRGSLLDTRETQALACFTKDVCGEKQIGASTHLYLTPLFRAGSFTCTPYIYHMPHTLDVPSLDFLSFKFPFGRTAYSLGSIQCLLGILLTIYVSF